ncbi:MAG: Gfo/Idh/MocA family oxidoreductase [Alphaproteobacteria bacterium]|nr:Gfo/Idh/MocA family oxidoreductase [Alphaproteobacteria bacterium]
MRIALVGCGLIGAKRLAALDRSDQVVAVCDLDQARAKKLAAQYAGAEIVADPLALCAYAKADAVVIAVTHDNLALLAEAAAKHGKHVMLEKPGARRPRELDPVIAAAKAAGVTVKVGFNHRFHPAMLKAREIFDSGEPGPVMFIRGRYGHGGRVGYEKEWRFDANVSGGGELLDQGSHLIDLSRWFMGDFARCWGRAPRYFWQGDVDDNAFMALESASGAMAWLHAGWSEWKNIFSLEIMCRNAKLQIDGLGGSYGVESLTHYKMLPEMGPPETTKYEYPFPDKSWQLEWAEFKSAIAEKRRPLSDLEDAKAVLAVVEGIYERNQAP